MHASGLAVTAQIEVAERKVVQAVPVPVLPIPDQTVAALGR
jgi:hypothetical protein